MGVQADASVCGTVGMRQCQHVLCGGGYLRVGEGGIATPGGHLEIALFGMVHEYCHPQ